jgi:hypothetical protein
VGKAICENQAIAVSAPLTVACIATRQVIPVKNLKDLERCTIPPQTIRRCDPQSRAFCPRTRTESVASKPTLIKPYGVVVRPKLQEFSWIKVAGADRYRVVLDAVNRPMEKQFTTDNRIVLKPPVGTFSIVIQGMSGDKVLASAVTTFDTLTDQSSHKVDLQLTMVDKFSASPSEKALLKVSILSDRGLVSDLIKLLESQSGENVVLIRTLAEMYRDEGELEKALANYEKAKSLATRKGDQEELSKAQEGYRLVSSWLQQPGT